MSLMFVLIEYWKRYVTARKIIDEVKLYIYECTFFYCYSGVRTAVLVNDSVVQLNKMGTKNSTDTFT